MLRYEVESFLDLRRKNIYPDSVRGPMRNLPEGCFCLKIFPNGSHNCEEASQSFSIYIECLWLRDPNVRGVRIGAVFTIIDAKENVLHSHGFARSTAVLNPTTNKEGGGTEADFVEYYGYHYYCNPSTLPETFCICADLVVRDVLYVSPEASSYHNSKHCTVNQAIELLKNAWQRESGEATRLRLPTEEELETFSTEQLLDHQTNIAKVLTEKNRLEATCGVCMEKEKDTALVPCGHRYCGQCCVSLRKCPECRLDIKQRLKIF